jgi:hypothetical protein
MKLTMRTGPLVALITVAALGSAFFLSKSHAAAIQSAIGVQSAQGARMTSSTQGEPVSALTSTAAVVSKLQGMAASFRSEAGLTASVIADTRPIFTFDSSAGSFASGLSVYETPLPDGGFCLTFAGPTGCTHVAPSLTEPLMGVGFDPDGERSGDPFVIVSIREPSVASVNYVCAGNSYPAHISGDVVWLVSPAATLSLEDCSEQVTFQNGQTLTKHV